MKKLFIALFLVLQSILLQAQYNCTAKHTQLLRKSTAAYTLVDIRRARIQLNINPNQLNFNGSTSLQFLAPENNFSTLGLDLHSSLRIEKIIYHQTELSTNTYTHANNLLLINLPNALNANKRDSVQIFYGGTPVQYSNQAVTQENHNQNGIWFTLSEPYGGSEWWPCQHLLQDKIDTLTVIVSSPEGNRTASNGVLKLHETQNGITTDQWLSTNPIAPYLVAVATTNYVENSRTISTGLGNIPLQSFYFPETASAWETDEAAIDGIFEYYQTRYGRYPFANEKYGHAAFTWGGGMEHQTMSFMANVSFGLVAHELAHQWFGDAITCASWQDIWLNEGFATYSEGLCYEAGLGNQTFDNWLARTYFYATSAADGSVFVPDTSEVSRVFSSRLSYNKGAMVLHMLRLQIGDEAYWQGIKTYITDSKLRDAYAYTADFKTHMEQASGENLSNFFDDWVYGEGFPTFRLEWAQATDGHTILKLKQSAALNPQQIFELRVPVLIEGQTESTYVWINSQRTESTTELNINFPISNISLIPHYEVMTRNKIVAENPALLLNFAPNEMGKQIKAVPNPSSSKTTLFWSEDLVYPEARLYSSSGKLLQTQWISSNQHFVRWDLSTYETGVYIVHLAGPGGNRAIQVVKQ